jgi:oligoendopeptidase F
MSRDFVRLLPVSLLIPGLLMATAAIAQTGKLRERSEIPEKDKWNLADLYADSAAWEADYAKCEKSVQDVAAFKGKATASPAALLQFLMLQDELGIVLDRLSAFASMSKDQDTRESSAQALAERARNLGVQLQEASSWFEPEVLALPPGQLLEWCKTDPKLTVYTHYFDDLLRQQKHVLSAREEELLAMSGKLASTPSSAFGMLTNADLKFPTIKDEKGGDLQLSEGRYFVILQNTNRDLREHAFKALMGTYLSYKNTLAALLAGSIQGDIFRARARHYDSALQAAVDPDNVPVPVYENLIATVHASLPTFHRYIELRRTQLKLDKAHVYDMFAPLTDAEAPEISYDDAVATVIKALAPLGAGYETPMQNGFASRWIDVYETPGKRTGAYSTGTYSSHPYMLLNFSGTYEDMFTVAHEMGHSMHTWFTQHNQPPIYGEYPLFLAEVASTCNEVILGDYLRKNAKTEAEKLYLVNLALEGIRGTVINQTMWAEFEKATHEAAEKGTPMNFEAFGKLYREITTKYYGPSFAYDDELDGYWSRVPHFYRAFYVYKYATSYCASVALARRVLSNDPEALAAYLGFLKSGSSDYPIEILKKAGVDMSTPKPIEATMQLFGELLDQLEGLLKK